MLTKLSNLWRSLNSPHFYDPVVPTAAALFTGERVEVETDQATMYTQAHDELHRLVQEGGDPLGELGLLNIFRAAQTLTADDWKLARSKRELGALSKEQRAHRAAVLDLLRLWWTEKQHLANNHAPMHLRIRAAEGWED